MYFSTLHSNSRNTTQSILEELYITKCLILLKRDITELTKKQDYNAFKHVIWT